MIQDLNDFKGAQESPRYNDDTDVLYWYEGDAFYIEWTLDVMGQTEGAIHEYGEDDMIVFSFYDIKKQLIQQFKFNVLPESHVIRMEFTPEVSAKFKAGTYTYCMKYYWTEEDGYRRIQTMIDHGLIKVEACH